MIEKVDNMSVQIIIDNLNNTINQHDISDIYRTLYPTTAEHIILSTMLSRWTLLRPCMTKNIFILHSDKMDSLIISRIPSWKLLLRILKALLPHYLPSSFTFERLSIVFRNCTVIDFVVGLFFHREGSFQVGNSSASFLR